MKTNKNEVQENNKLIAEFMGYKIHEILDGSLHYVNLLFEGKKIDYTYYNTRHEGEKEKNLTRLWERLTLKYNSDWNDLMQAVEKIRVFHNGTQPLNDNQIGQLLNHIKKINEALTLRNNVSIQAVYQAVVEFIKWYNSANKK